MHCRDPGSLIYLWAIKMYKLHTLISHIFFKVFTRQRKCHSQKRWLQNSYISLLKSSLIYFGLSSKLWRTFQGLFRVTHFSRIGKFKSGVISRDFRQVFRTSLWTQILTSYFVVRLDYLSLKANIDLTFQVNKSLHLLQQKSISTSYPFSQKITAMISIHKLMLIKGKNTWIKNVNWQTKT